MRHARCAARVRGKLVLMKIVSSDFQLAMPLKSENKHAAYKALSQLALETGATLKWHKLELPFGAKIEIIVKYEEVNYLRGLIPPARATRALRDG